MHLPQLLQNALPYNWLFKLLGLQSFSKFYIMTLHLDIKPSSAATWLKHLLLIGFSALLLQLPFASAFAQGCGDVVGMTGLSAAGVSRVDLVSTPSGDLFMSFADASANSDLTVMSFNGSQWQTLGASGFGNLVAEPGNLPSLILANGTPLVAYADDDKAGLATVEVYDGTQWIDLSPDGVGTNSAIDPAIVFDQNNTLFLALGDGALGARVYEYFSDDMFFGEIELDVLVAGATRDFSLEVDQSTGDLYVSFLHEIAANDWQVRVFKYNAANFEFDDISPIQPYRSFGFNRNDLKLAAFNGQLAIAFSDRDAADKMTVAQYNGSSWQIVGSRGFSAVDISDPEVLFRDGRLYASYLDYDQTGSDAQIRYYDGTQWIAPCPAATSFAVGFSSALTASDTQLFFGLAQNPSGRASVFSFPLTPTVAPTINATINTPDGTDLSCGTIDLLLDGSASSGAPNLQYLWSTGETTDVIFVDQPGTYTLTITDPVSGASDMASVTITEIVLVVSINATTTDLTNAQPTATLTAQATGAPSNALVEYLWNTGETTQSITVGSAGSYSVTVRYLDPDDMFVLCDGQANITITDSRSGTTVVAEIATPEGTDLTCGTIDLLLDGSTSSGAPNLQYLWSTGETTATIFVDQPGTYTLTVTDPASGASDMASVAITESLLMVRIDATTTDLTNAQPTAGLTAQANGAPANALVEYLWSTGETTQSISVGSAGSYSVTITYIEPEDMFVLCDGQASITITDSRGGGGNPDCARIVASAQELDCQTSTITLDASSSLGGDLGPATYQWNTGSTTATITVSTPGTYTVIVDAPTIGCLDTASIIITQSAAVPTVVIVFPGDERLDCGVASVTLDGSDSSGDGPLTYLWSTGSTEPIIEVTEVGTYTLTVTDLNANCSASASVTVGGTTAGLLDASFLVAAEVCAGDSLYLFDYSLLEAMADVDFSWDFGDGTTSMERDPIHTYATAGSYTVQLEVSSGGCPPELLIKPVDVLQCLLLPNGYEVQALVYPTLSAGVVTLRAELPEPSPMYVDVVDARGQVVSVAEFGRSDRLHEVIELPSVAGLYVLRLRYVGGERTMRVVRVDR